MGTESRQTNKENERKRMARASVDCGYIAVNFIDAGGLETLEKRSQEQTVADVDMHLAGLRSRL